MYCFIVTPHLLGGRLWTKRNTISANARRGQVKLFGFSENRRGVIIPKHFCSVFFSLALVVLSLACAMGLTLVIDRTMGLLLPAAAIPYTKGLVFPPHSEMAFRTMEFAYTVHINALGLRGRELTPQKTHALRIAAIGDSFTYGLGVDLEQTWVAQLECNLREAGVDVEIVNLGKPGAGALFYAEIAERALPVVHPDIVIVAMLQSDDVSDSGDPTGRVSKHPLLEKVQAIYPNMTRLVDRGWGRTADTVSAQTVQQPMRATADENQAGDRRAAAFTLKDMTPEQRARYDGIDAKVKEAFTNGDLNPFLVGMASRFPNFFVSMANGNDPGLPPCIDRTSACLQRIRRAANQCNARVVVLSVPHGVYVNRPTLLNYRKVGFNLGEDLLDTDVPDRCIEEACRKAHLPFVGVTSEFRRFREAPDLYYPLDGHFTAAGHKLYAELLTPLLVRELVGKPGNP